MKKYLTWGVLAATLVAVMVLVGGNQSASKVSADGSMVGMTTENDGVWVPGPVIRELLARFLGGQSDSLGLSNEPGSAVVGGFGTHFPNGLAVAPSTTTISRYKFTVGHLGTPVANHNFGTCNAYGPSAGISASTTAIYMCTATGVRSGDVVTVQLPLGAHVATAKAGGVQSFGQSGANNVLVIGGAGATTSDVIGFEISNYGPATTTFRQATTSLNWHAYRP